MALEGVPARLRGGADRARRAVRDATAAPRAARAASQRLARVTAPVVGPTPGPPADAPLAVVQASEGMTRGLATQWHLVDRVGDDVTLALVEVDASTEVAAQAPLEDQARLLAAASAAGVPSVVWVTGSVGEESGVRALERLVRADDELSICVDDASAVDGYAARLGRAVSHLSPAADPFVHSPARSGPAVRREHAVAVVGDSGFDIERLAPASPARLDVLGRDVTTTLDGDRPVLAHYRATAVVGEQPHTPWRVLESAMSGTPVIAGPGVLERVPPAVAQASTMAADDVALRQHVVASLWQDELVDRSGLAAARAARSYDNTYAHHAVDLAAAAGLVPVLRDGVTGDRGVSAVVSTNRAHELPTVAANIARQVEHAAGNVQLVLVLHGLDVATAEVDAMLRDAGVEGAVIRHAPADLTLGACLNLGVEAADGRYIAKVDDDNYYGRHYLTDLVDAFGYSGAQVVGKWCHYTWLRSTGAVVLRFPKDEHRYHHRVQGGSIVMDGDALRDMRFSDLPRRVDTTLLDRAKEAGMTIYSADRFGYVSIRGTDRHAHTWTIEDTAFLNASGRVEFYGDPREHVDV